MAQDNSDKLLWLLTGAALGATVALLYAPQSGDHTRRLIAKKARQGREAIAERGGDLIDKGRDIISERGSDLLDTGRTLYKQGRRVADQAAEVIERGRKLADI
jgi:gas vesicle protein